MARSIIILILFVSISMDGQSFLVDDIFPTNKGTAPTIPIAPPNTQSAYQFIPENGGVASGNVIAVDLQGLSLQYGSSKNWSFSTILSTVPSGISPFYQYRPSSSLTGTDSNIWFAFNTSANATNTTFVTTYTTNFASPTCGVPCTNQFVTLMLPTANGIFTGTNFFFSFYSQTSPFIFSNCYYFNNASGVWGQVPTSDSVSNILNPIGIAGKVLFFFPTIQTNDIFCVNMYGSNSPCTMTAPTNFGVAVLTNSVSTFLLQGSTPTYVISAQPTNGYLTNLNGTTGQITYVETNNSATADYFTYCTSNSTICQLCANVNIDISGPISCGSCFVANSLIGGVVTGDINLNVGVTNQTVCIYYTNAACALQTNCTVTDQYGNARFFVHFCPGSSNYCVASLSAPCTNLCYFGHVFFGDITHTAPPYGDYYLSQIAFTTNAPNVSIQVTLTNSQDTTGSTAFTYDSSGQFFGSTAYCQGQVPPLPSYCTITGIYIYTGQQFFGNGQNPIFNADCTSVNPGNTIVGWQAVCPSFFETAPCVFDDVHTFPICTQTCP